MEINFPNLITKAIPENEKGKKNVIILSSNPGPNPNEQGFLSQSFPRTPPKLYITAESDDFDNSTLQFWRDEGFAVEYLPMGRSTSAYKTKLTTLKTQSNLGPCETYGIVAYGDAAAVCLEHFHVMENNPEFKLACLIAYYPTHIPDPRGQFPSSLQVLVHLAGEDVDVVSHSQIVGIQGKRKVTRRKVEKGLGVGGLHAVAYPCYTYAAAEPGFAEPDLEEYDKVAAELSWSRSLAAVRRAFRMHVDHEMLVEQNVQGKFYSRHLGQTMATYATHKPPHVTYFPTLTGGIGAQELQRFYAEYFLQANPASTKLTLISRTNGGDRVVDELHVAFKHTQEMPWILPGVPPTNRRVEIMVVSIVTVRGGKLWHEHVYWDQASVLVQVGLLDPKLVPDKASARGVSKLPVVGREAARRLIQAFDEEEDGEADNELIPGWYDDYDDDDDEGYNDKNRETKKSVPSVSKSKGNPNGRDVERVSTKEPEQSKDVHEHLPRNVNGEKVENPISREKKGKGKEYKSPSYNSNSEEETEFPAPVSKKKPKDQNADSDPTPVEQNPESFTEADDNDVESGHENNKKQQQKNKKKSKAHDTNRQEKEGEMADPTPKIPEDEKEQSGKTKGEIEREHDM